MVRIWSLNVKKSTASYCLSVAIGQRKQLSCVKPLGSKCDAIRMDNLELLSWSQTCIIECLFELIKLYIMVMITEVNQELQP